MEEVNSHVEFAHGILRQEYQHLKLKKKFEKDFDHDLRLETYAQADCILCPSEFVRRSFISKGFAPDRLIKVNFGFPSIDTSSQHISYAKDQTFRLLYVGQLHYRKGLRYAIEAFRQLKHPKKEFAIVGPKTSVTGLEKTNIPKGVIFTGPLKGEALKEQYRSASVFVLPSVEEGLALVQGEALSFGLPLLITTNTGGDDIITDGVEGFIVQPMEVMSLLNRLQQMVDDKDILINMSLAALNTARALGDWKRTADKLVSELEIVVKSKN
jgi:starch synthase